MIKDVESRKCGWNTLLMRSKYAFSHQTYSQKMVTIKLLYLHFMSNANMSDVHHITVYVSSVNYVSKNTATETRPWLYNLRSMVIHVHSK